MPIVQEIPYGDPLDHFSLFSKEKGALFFDTPPAVGGLRWPDDTGWYSFWAYNPKDILRAKNGVITYQGRTFEGNPFKILKEITASFTLKTLSDLPPWQGGLGGYFSYDLLHHLEKVSSPSIDDMQFPDCILGVYETVVSYDHLKQKAYVVSHGTIEQVDSITSRLEKGESTAGLPKDLRMNPEQPSLRGACDEAIQKNWIATPPSGARNDVTENFDEETYPPQVQKVIDYIFAGDIFQANLTRRWKIELPKGYDYWSLYQKLRNYNPAPFAAYLNFDPVFILSASPERFLSLRDDHVQTRPIKGTRKRYPNDMALDQEMQKDLTTSLKDRSENIMIVDLLRNDLSRVCLPHTVKTPNLLGLETYATVHHLVSTVTGQLRPEYNAIDLLEATFPGGSITGAPKIRAMEIIHELEPNCRGPYCGAIGYIGFDGTMDTSIVIRTYCINNQVLTFQAGGGIVADSNPVEEYHETEAKAAALIKVLTGGYEGEQESGEGGQEVDKKLLAMLVCPVTKGSLQYDREAKELISLEAKLAYPIRDNIPIMIPEEARKI